MKRLIIVFITWMLVGVTVTAAWAAGPAKPVIEAEMPDCYSYIGGSGITLFTKAWQDIRSFRCHPSQSSIWIWTSSAQCRT